MVSKNAGMTLVELLVVMVIVAILASVAVPYAEVTVQRNKEIELKRALRSIRNAIDAFHADIKSKRLTTLTRIASEDGYPVNLQVLVDGAELKGSIEGRRYYLRRLPLNPLVSPTKPFTQHWQLRGYRDAADAGSWNNIDVYDVRVNSDKTALDGTTYASW